MVSHLQPVSLALSELSQPPNAFLVPEAPVDAKAPLAIAVRFGERLRSLRLSASKSTAELAMQLNVLKSHLDRIEVGLEEVDLVLLDRIATALGTTIDELLLGL